MTPTISIDLAVTNMQPVLGPDSSLIADPSIAVIYLCIVEAADQVFKHETLGETALPCSQGGCCKGCCWQKTLTEASTGAQLRDLPFAAYIEQERQVGVQKACHANR